jgi:hypothetical protein
MWRMRLLFIVVSIVAVVASGIVIWQMMHRSGTDAASANAAAGSCLTWPRGEADHSSQVDCAEQHLFEVASTETVDDNVQAPVRQQICAKAVTSYLGPRYDPGGRFVVGAVSTPGQLMCGLQLPSNGVASVGFKGRVADQDQSNIFPTGTCLGIREGQTTDVAVDCGLPHALEITGTVDLSTKFGQAAPSTAAQDAVVRDACGVATSAYLAPVTLDATSLAVRYQPIEETGWAAGSRRVACRIGAPKPDGGWETLVRSAKSGVRIDGQRAGTVPSYVAPPPPVVAPPPAETPPSAEVSAPVEEAPAEVAAPTSEVEAPTSQTAEPTHAAEVPVRVNRDTDDSTADDGPVPHMDGSEGPGPVPHMAGSPVPGPMPHMVGPVSPGPAPAPATTSAAPTP